MTIVTGMTPKVALWSRRTRLATRAAAVTLGGAIGVLVSSLPAGAAGTSTSTGSGYGYGYGYGYGGATSNLLRTAFNAQTVVAALPAGALLAGAVLWERRSTRRALADQLSA